MQTEKETKGDLVITALKGPRETVFLFFRHLFLVVLRDSQFV